MQMAKQCEEKGLLLEGGGTTSSASAASAAAPPTASREEMLVALARHEKASRKAKASSQLRLGDSSGGAGRPSKRPGRAWG